MGLKESFLGAAKAVFKAAGNVKISATYKRLGSSSYNPITGEVVKTTEETAIEVIRVEVTSEDKMGDHLAEVEGLYMILAEDISGVTPKPGDVIEVDGQDREVKDVVTDPIKAVWEIGV